MPPGIGVDCGMNLAAILVARIRYNPLVSAADASYSCMRKTRVIMTQPIDIETLAKQGWIHIAPVGWLWPEDWAHFLAVIGDENYQIIRELSVNNPDDGREMRRGELMVSPMGLAWMEASSRMVH